MDESYSTTWVHHILYSRLHYFYFGVIINSTSVNTVYKIFYGHLLPVLLSMYLAVSGITGAYDNSKLKILRAF